MNISHGKKYINETKTQRVSFRRSVNRYYLAVSESWRDETVWGWEEGEWTVPGDTRGEGRVLGEKEGEERVPG